MKSSPRQQKRSSASFKQTMRAPVRQRCHSVEPTAPGSCSRWSSSVVGFVHSAMATRISARSHFAFAMQSRLSARHPKATSLQTNPRAQLSLPRRPPLASLLDSLLMWRSTSPTFKSRVAHPTMAEWNASAISTSPSTVATMAGTGSRQAARPPIVAPSRSTSP